MSNPERKFGVEYHLWREGEYLGTATWTDDPNIGPNFLKKDENGVNEVYKADRWEEVPEKVCKRCDNFQYDGYSKKLGYCSMVDDLNAEKSDMIEDWGDYRTSIKVGFHFGCIHWTPIVPKPKIESRIQEAKQKITIQYKPRIKPE